MAAYSVTPAMHNWGRRHRPSALTLSVVVVGARLEEAVAPVRRLGAGIVAGTS